MVEVTIDGQVRQVPEGSTLLDAARAMGADIPTLCYGDTLTPKNACRVCMVEVEGARVLAPSCSRKVEPGMVVHTDSPRARLARRMVLEFLASSVDLSAAAPEVEKWMVDYGAEPVRYGAEAATVAQPAKVDNGLYVRDYGRCILCYKCVDACGEQWQQTFAIAVAGRGFDSRISTEWDTPLPDSACVYCGNCVEVCPTGALSFTGGVQPPGGGDVGPVPPDPDGHHLPLLRRRLHPAPPRPGQPRSSRSPRPTTSSSPEGTSASRDDSASRTSSRETDPRSVEARFEPSPALGPDPGGAGRAAS